MNTILLILFFIFSIALVFVVVYQAKIKNSLKGRQSPEKEKVLNYVVTGVGIIFFVIVFLLSFNFNHEARSVPFEIKNLIKESSTTNNQPTNTNPQLKPNDTTTTQPAPTPENSTTTNSQPAQPNQQTNNGTTTTNTTTQTTPNK